MGMCNLQHAVCVCVGEKVLMGQLWQSHCLTDGVRKRQKEKLYSHIDFLIIFWLFHPFLLLIVAVGNCPIEKWALHIYNHPTRNGGENTLIADNRAVVKFMQMLKHRCQLNLYWN